jgi:hypothetical protein
MKENSTFSEKYSGKYFHEKLIFFSGFSRFSGSIFSRKADGNPGEIGGNYFHEKLNSPAGAKNGKKYTAGVPLIDVFFHEKLTHFLGRKCYWFFPETMVKAAFFDFIKKKRFFL